MSKLVNHKNLTQYFPLDLLKKKSSYLITTYCRTHHLIFSSKIIKKLVSHISNQKNTKRLAERFLIHPRKHGNSMRHRVIKNFVQHGFITTVTSEKVSKGHASELRRLPDDLKDIGFPIINIKVPNPKPGNGHPIAGYILGRDKDFNYDRAGRRAFTKENRMKLYKVQLKYQQTHGHPNYKHVHCPMCGQIIRSFADGQIDHRIPYKYLQHINDNMQPFNFNNYQFLCASDNRKKDIECEQHDKFMRNATADDFKHEYIVHPENYSTKWGKPYKNPIQPLHTKKGIAIESEKEKLQHKLGLSNDDMEVFNVAVVHILKKRVHDKLHAKIEAENATMNNKKVRKNHLTSLRKKITQGIHHNNIKRVKLPKSSSTPINEDYRNKIFSNLSHSPSANHQNKRENNKPYHSPNLII